MTFQNLFFNIILNNYSFFKNKVRINTINKPKPINPKEKVAKKESPIIKVFRLDEIFWTISELLVGRCFEKYKAIFMLIL